MFTIYNPETYRMLRVFKNGYWQDAQYATATAAKAQLTKLTSGLKPKIQEGEWQVISMADYSANEPMVEVINMQSGKPCMIPISQQGGCCDPSTETYWSM
jgi:hypothetical protein